MISVIPELSKDAARQVMTSFFKRIVDTQGPNALTSRQGSGVFLGGFNVPNEDVNINV